MTVERTTKDSGIASSTGTSTEDIVPGSVTIDSIGDRVTGSMTVMAQGDMLGAIDISGAFDIRKCF